MDGFDYCSGGHPPFSLVEIGPNLYECRRCGREINAVPCHICGVLRVKGLHDDQRCGT